MTTQFYVSLITLVVVVNASLGATAYLILLERKIASWVQDRVGPNRAGPWGLLQPMADGLKFLMKEDYIPANVDRALFLLAPVLAIVPALIGWAIMPWGGYLEWGGEVVLVAAAPINIGVVFTLAVGSLAVYGVVVGGYASTNKYSFLGGLRATAQMLSYEIPQGLSVLIVILMFSTLHAGEIAQLQANAVWTIAYQPLLAVIFFICVLAECNRAPFDLAEAEQELVGGYHTEYSSMKFALFFLGEYIHMITGSAFFVLLFLGAFDLPFLQESALAGGLGLVLLKAGVFAGKVALILAVMMWIRWTLPRFRFDQLMKLAWRGLIPISLVLLLATGILEYLRPDGVARVHWHWTLLGANVLVAIGTVIIAPMLPKGPSINRRVPLAGSRFNPPTTANG